MKPKSTNKLLNYADFYLPNTPFIETGTCSGAGTQRALDAGFTDVRSVEYSPEYFGKSAERFRGVSTVKLWFGNSYEQLPLMLKGAGSCVIFLDAHPAGPGTAGHDEVISGNEEFGQHVIITKELEVILAHRNDHVIIIDDQNGANDDNAEYMAACLKANPNYRFFFYDENLSGDRLYKDKALVCIVA